MLYHHKNLLVLSLHPVPIFFGPDPVRVLTNCQDLKHEYSKGPDITPEKSIGKYMMGTHIDVNFCLKRASGAVHFTGILSPLGALSAVGKAKVRRKSATFARPNSSKRTFLWTSWYKIWRRKKPCCQILMDKFKFLQLFHPTRHFDVPCKKLAPQFWLSVHPLLIFLQPLKINLKITLCHELLNNKVSFFFISHIGKELN